MTRVIVGYGKEKNDKIELPDNVCIGLHTYCISELHLVFMAVLVQFFFSVCLPCSFYRLFAERRCIRKLCYHSP